MVMSAFTIYSDTRVCISFWMEIHLSVYHLRLSMMRQRRKPLVAYHLKNFHIYKHLRVVFFRVSSSLPLWKCEHFAWIWVNIVPLSPFVALSVKYSVIFFNETKLKTEKIYLFLHFLLLHIFAKRILIWKSIYSMGVTYTSLSYAFAT